MCGWAHFASHAELFRASSFVLTRRALMQPVRLAACTGCLSAETSRSCWAAAPVHTQCLTIWRWAASRACRVSQLFRDKQAAKQTCRVSRRNYTMLCVCVCARETSAAAALLSPEMRHARSNWSAAHINLHNFMAMVFALWNYKLFTYLAFDGLRLGNERLVILQIWLRRQHTVISHFVQTKSSLWLFWHQ